MPIYKSMPLAYGKELVEYAETQLFESIENNNALSSIEKKEYRSACMQKMEGCKTYLLSAGCNPMKREEIAYIKDYKINNNEQLTADQKAYFCSLVDEWTVNTRFSDDETVD